MGSSRGWQCARVRLACIDIMHNCAINRMATFAGAPHRKLRPWRPGGEAEVGGDGLADVGEADRGRWRAAARPGPAARTGTRSRVWSVPRQVGSLPWSAVRIRRSPGRRRAEDLGQAGVEGLERAGVAGDVAGVAVERVEVDVVGEDEVAVRRRVEGGERGVDERHVVLALGERRDAAVGEDVADLADGVGAAAGRDHPVEQRRLGRRDGEVAAVGGAGEGRGGLADERAGDDAADPQRMHDLGGDAADLVEALEAEMRLVRGDLQHAVGGGVEDRLAGARCAPRRSRASTGMPEEWALQSVPGRPARAISGPVTSGGIAGSVRGK